MPNQNCAQKGIPEHLHQDNRDEDPDFDDAELLYRRFLSKVDSRDELIAALSTRSMSVNRDRYSEEPEDVLYNINANHPDDHFFDCGILEFDVESVETINVEHPQLDNRSYSFRVLHRPSQCMYPHSVVKVVETIDGDDNIVDDISSGMVKLDLKDQICEHIDEVKEIE